MSNRKSNLKFVAMVEENGLRVFVEGEGNGEVPDSHMRLSFFDLFAGALMCDPDKYYEIEISIKEEE
jgi:hypothetical protein